MNSFEPEYLDFVKKLIPNAVLGNIEPIVDGMYGNYIHTVHFKTNYSSKFIAHFVLQINDTQLPIKVGISGSIESDSDLCPGNQIPAVFNNTYLQKHIIRKMCHYAEPIYLPQIDKSQSSLKSLIRKLRKAYPSRKLCEVDPKNLILAKVFCDRCNTPIKNHDSRMICAVTQKGKYDSYNLCNDISICNFKSALI